MANMDYCRFENTLPDLRDCYDHLDEVDLSETEQKDRRRIIKICCEIAQDYSDEVDFSLC